MKTKDQLLLEQAYVNVQRSQFVAYSYNNSNLKNIFSEDIWNSNSLEAKLMFVEAFSIGQQSDILEEGILSNIGKAVLTPIQIAGKIYTSISKPIEEFVNKYGYEKTGLKEIDEKTFNSVVSKFNEYVDKLNPQAASFIKKSLSEAQTVVRGNPIKMALLAVALTTAMSFAGAPLLAIFAAACLLRGTIGLLKGEKPIQAFGKSLITGTIGKVLGLAGREVFEYFTSASTDKLDVSLNKSVSDFDDISNDKESADEDSLRALSFREIGSRLMATFGLKSADVVASYKEEISQHFNLDEPTTPREVITNAWIRLGMNEMEAQQLVNNAFQKAEYANKELLDKKIFITTAEEIQRSMSSEKFIELLYDNQGINEGTKGVTDMLFTEIAERLKTNKFDLSKMTQEEFVKLINSDSHLRKIIQHYKNLFATTIAPTNADGLTLQGANFIIINPNTGRADDFLNQIIPHEATHTIQRYNVTGNPSSFALNNSASDDTERYLFDIRETEAWSGNIKRFFYGKTKIVLNDENFEEKYKQFENFISQYNPKTQWETNVVEAAKKFIKQYNAAPEKFNFKEILQNVAMSNPSKNVSNIA